MVIYNIHGHNLANQRISKWCLSYQTTKVREAGVRQLDHGNAPWNALCSMLLHSPPSFDLPRYHHSHRHDHRLCCYSDPRLLHSSPVHVKVEIHKIQFTRVSRPWVSNLFERRAKCTNFKPVGGQIEMPKASRGRDWGGVSLPSWLWGLGERCKLPHSQWGPWLSRGRERVLAYFRAWKNTPDRHKSIIFDISRPRGPDRKAWQAGLWPAGPMLDTPGLGLIKIQEIHCLKVKIHMQNSKIQYQPWSSRKHHLS